MLTGFNIKSKNEKMLSGSEMFPIQGSAITYSETTAIMKTLKGLTCHWHCIEKARIVVSTLNKGVVVIGSLHIVSGDGKSTYGYDFNPPFEFHAWVNTKEGIIDVSLPGVIERGLTTCDEYGPYIVGREPTILAGAPLSWMLYKPFEYERR